MDLVKALLKEHSRQQANAIVQFVGADKKKFEQLFKVFKAGPYRVTQRAAWPLSLVVDLHPQLIIPHLKEMIEIYSRPGIHDAVKRNIMRILQTVEIPSKFHGAVADISFTALGDHRQPVAIRVFAMTVLANIAKKNPDLSKELTLMIEDHLPFAKPAYLSRANKILKSLGRQPNNYVV